MSRRDRARALGEKKGAHTVCRISDLEEQGAWVSNIVEHGLWDVRSKSLRVLEGLLVGFACPGVAFRVQSSFCCPIVWNLHFDMTFR